MPVMASVQARGDRGDTLSIPSIPSDDEEGLVEPPKPKISDLGWGPWFASRLPTCAVLEPRCATTPLHQEWLENDEWHEDDELDPMDEEPAKMVPARSDSPLDWRSPSSVQPGTRLLQQAHPSSPPVRKSPCSVQPVTQLLQRRAHWKCCTLRDDGIGGEFSMAEHWHEEEWPQPPVSRNFDVMCLEEKQMKPSMHPGSRIKPERPCVRHPGDLTSPKTSFVDCVARPLSTEDPFCGRWARPGDAAASTTRPKERPKGAPPLKLLSPRTSQRFNSVMARAGLLTSEV